MAEPKATTIEVEAGIEADIEADRNVSYEEPWSSYYSTCSAGTPEEDGSASASTAISARTWKHPYIIVASETTPLLYEAEPMSAQLSSPIEIVGIEGQDGARRPWLGALEAKKKPWWETPSVRIRNLCPFNRH